jgi:superfamily II DNA or RNA helicase
VTHYRRLCAGVPAIAFCASIAHAENVAANFREAGFRWGVIDGTMTPEVRRQAVADLGTGALHGLSSCEIVSEGFDLPCVTAAILLRPTKSLALYLQQVGRVLRPHPGKQNAVILDHVGNVLRHGLAEELRGWSLEGAGERRQKRTADDGIKNRQCPACYAVHAPGLVCPLCGHEYEAKGRQVEEVAGELEQLDAERLAAVRKHKAQGKARTLGELIALGRARGYKNPTAWASYVFTARQKRGVPV